MQTAVVLGAGGFVGHHLVRRLAHEGWCVRAVLGTKGPAFSTEGARWTLRLDLCDPAAARFALRPMADHPVDRVYQLAAHMGGVGYIATGAVDSKVMRSALINLNVAHAAVKERIGRLFFSSSACVYPPHAPVLVEDAVYPANPDTEYGWEKIYSERLFQTYQRNEGLDIRIGRFHSLYGPEICWRGGREKAPAALVRKLLQSASGEPIDIWGDGQQLRTYLHIDDALTAVEALMTHAVLNPMNIGSPQLISITDLALLLMSLLDIHRPLAFVPGPTGTAERGCPIDRIQALTGWTPQVPLDVGMLQMAAWIRGEWRHGH